MPITNKENYKAFSSACKYKPEHVHAREAYSNISVVSLSTVCMVWGLGGLLAPDRWDSLDSETFW